MFSFELNFFSPLSSILRSGNLTFIFIWYGTSRGSTSKSTLLPLYIKLPSLCRLSCAYIFKLEMIDDMTINQKKTKKKQQKTIMTLYCHCCCRHPRRHCRAIIFVSNLSHVSWYCRCQRFVTMLMLPVFIGIPKI